jgi:hypothetical protein
MKERPKQLRPGLIRANPPLRAIARPLPLESTGLELSIKFLGEFACGFRQARQTRLFLKSTVGPLRAIFSAISSAMFMSSATPLRRRHGSTRRNVGLRRRDLTRPMSGRLALNERKKINKRAAGIVDRALAGKAQSPDDVFIAETMAEELSVLTICLAPLEQRRHDVETAALAPRAMMMDALISNSLGTDQTGAYYRLMRSAEMKGISTDPAKLEQLTTQAFSYITAFAGKLTPQDFQTFARRGGTAWMNMKP